MEPKIFPATRTKCDPVDLINFFHLRKKRNEGPWGRGWRLSTSTQTCTVRVLGWSAVCRHCQATGRKYQAVCGSVVYFLSLSQCRCLMYLIRSWQSSFDQKGLENSPLNTKPAMHGAYDTQKWKPPESTDDTINVNNLPRNLRLARERPVPWSHSPFYEDFIVVAEFSENEGPRPLITIPKDGGGNFDMNAFAVHVMSVDYQAQTRGSPFSVVDDTQLFLTEKKENVYAYVHNFTLYDIHARGFVRPFCMCYLSHSKKKIIDCFSKLMEEFTKVSKCFRFGNIISFSKDLEQRLIDLYTLKALNNTLFNLNGEKDTEKTETAADNSKEDFECILKETNTIIEALKPHVNDSRIAHQFKQLEDLAAGIGNSFSISHNKDSGASYNKPIPPFETGGPCSLMKASSLPDLCKTNTTNVLNVESFLPAYLHSMKQLRALHELCGWGAKEGLSKLKNILKHYIQDGVAVSVESKEATLLEPVPSLLTIGKSVVSNFLHKVNLKSAGLAQFCNKPCLNPVIRDLSRNASLGSLGSCCSSLESFQSCLEEDVVGSAHSSDDVISPFMSSVLFHSELHSVEVSDGDREGSDTSRTDNSDPSYSGPLLLGINDNLSLADSDFGDEDVSSDTSFSGLSRQSSATFEKCSTIVNTKVKSRSMENLSMPNEIITRVEHPIAITRGLTKHSFVRGRSRSSIISSADRIPVSNVTSELSSKDVNVTAPRRACRRTRSEGYTVTETGGKVQLRKSQYVARPERVQLRCFAEEVCQGLENYSGSNVLLFRNSYSCGVHLISALLCGRPVIILADPQNERDVRILISALWMFVPENRSHAKAVVPWKKKPLHILDLAWLRLAGLSKSKHSKMLPKSVERFVSVLDFETGHILTPPYKGIYLNSIFHPKNRWPTNAVLVAYIHSVFLELASKAYVYYYSYCLCGLCACKSGLIQACGHVKVQRDGSEILSSLGVYFSDARIVQYLTEIIKQQQIDCQQNLSFDHGTTTDPLDGTVDPDADSSGDKLPSTVFADFAKCILYCT